ncbi:hypothetical protein PG997_011797 [Apiospora hydei]|uniref:Uncharacterized protein n=1 Tax=Apiospora hydei TaxID=1337664 RepID=A0ABR1V1I1_9PEZI
MATQIKDFAEVGTAVIQVPSDSDSDSGSDTAGDTATTSSSADHAVHHSVAALNTASPADTAVDNDVVMADEPVAVKRSLEDPEAAAAAEPAPKRQKSAPVFKTVKAKTEERKRRRELMAAELEAVYNLWEQANMDVTKKQKLAIKKEMMKSLDKK